MDTLFFGGLIVGDVTPLSDRPESRFIGIPESPTSKTEIGRTLEKALSLARPNAKIQTEMPSA
jgi:hypothetical protein